MKIKQNIIWIILCSSLPNENILCYCFTFLLASLTDLYPGLLMPSVEWIWIEFCS